MVVVLIVHVDGMAIFALKRDPRIASDGKRRGGPSLGVQPEAGRSMPGGSILRSRAVSFGQVVHNSKQLVVQGNGCRAQVARPSVTGSGSEGVRSSTDFVTCC